MTMMLLFKWENAVHFHWAVPSWHLVEWRAAFGAGLSPSVSTELVQPVCMSCSAWSWSRKPCGVRGLALINLFYFTCLMPPFWRLHLGRATHELLFLRWQNSQLSGRACILSELLSCWFLGSNLIVPFSGYFSPKVYGKRKNGNCYCWWK